MRNHVSVVSSCGHVHIIYIYVHIECIYDGGQECTARNAATTAMRSVFSTCQRTAQSCVRRHSPPPPPLTFTWRLLRIPALTLRLSRRMLSLLSLQPEVCHVPVCHVPICHMSRARMSRARMSHVTCPYVTCPYVTCHVPVCHVPICHVPIQALTPDWVTGRTSDVYKPAPDISSGYHSLCS